MSALKTIEMLWSKALPVTLVLSAAAIHLWAGWTDAGHFTVIPNGHGVVLALFAWLVSFSISTLCFFVSTPRSRWAGASAILALVGVALIVGPAVIARSM